MPSLRENQQKAAYTRWSKPEAVDQRIDSIVESARRKLEKLPPLNETQRSKLAALLADQDGGRSDESR